MLESVALSPRIASRIETDAETLLSGAHTVQIRELLEQRGVLVFHGIDFSDDEMKSFAMTLGNIQGGANHDDEIFKVTFDPDHNPLGQIYLQGTLAWHIDRADIDVPPLGSMVTPRVLSPSGGQTEFANTYAAFEDLPEEEQQFLEGLEVVHRTDEPMRHHVPNPTEEQLSAWQLAVPKTHPMVWRHRSGRKSLVLGGTACSVVGMEQAESDALLDRLMKWSQQPQYVYRHHWTMGDLLIWDNTGTMHRVVPFDMASGRRLHRVTLEGEESIAATV